MDISAPADALHRKVFLESAPDFRYTGDMDRRRRKQNGPEFNAADVSADEKLPGE